MKIELIIVSSYQIYLSIIGLSYFYNSIYHHIALKIQSTNSRVRSRVCFYLCKIYVDLILLHKNESYYIVVGETIVSLGIDIPRHRRERGDASNYFCSTLHSQATNLSYFNFVHRSISIRISITRIPNKQLDSM